RAHFHTRVAVAVRRLSPPRALPIRCQIATRSDVPVAKCLPVDRARAVSRSRTCTAEKTNRAETRLRRPFVANSGASHRLPEIETVVARPHRPATLRHDQAPGAT